MYCTNCGKKRNENEQYCTNCGNNISNNQKFSTNSNKETNNTEIISLVLGIISFVFLGTPIITIVLAIVSIILGKQAKKETGEQSVGAILGIVSLILAIILSIFIIATLLILIFSVETIPDKYQETIPDYYYEEYYDKNSDESDSFDISGKSWLGTDKSMLYLNNDETYIWYQDDNNHEDNYIAGTYQVYTGKEAINYISNKLSQYGLTEEIQRNIIGNKDYDIEDYYLIILNCNKSIINNEEQPNINNQLHYYGFYNKTQKQLELINMSTNNNAVFNLNNKISEIDI